MSIEIAKKNNKRVIYVIATPIGNLEDITYRAVRILKEVDIILCEDKRVTIKLLEKYGIKSRLITFNKLNEKKNIENIISLIDSGKTIALVSDAGTPLISDPGASLVSVSRANNIKIVPIPGPSSLTTFLSVCGLEVKDFLFVGFLPDNKSEREKIISSFKDRSSLIILFVAPHDIERYLNEIHLIYSDVNVLFAREMTKIYEEFWFGNISDLIRNLESMTMKGEMVLGLFMGSFSLELEEKGYDEDYLFYKMKTLVDGGESLKQASKQIGKEYSVESRKLYSLFLSRK